MVWYGESSFTKKAAEEERGQSSRGVEYRGRAGEQEVGS